MGQRWGSSAGLEHVFHCCRRRSDDALQIKAGICRGSENPGELDTWAILSPKLLRCEPVVPLPVPQVTVAGDSPLEEGRARGWAFQSW